MPKDKDPLIEDQIKRIRQWIAEGAQYAPHWSFVPPVAEAPPAVKNQAWVRNPIDAFVLAELERRGMFKAYLTLPSC